jgi:hypothetical protein
MKKTILFLFVCMVVSAGLKAQATKTIMDAQHGCRVTIPGSWKTNSILTGGNAVDNSLDAAVAASAVNGQTMAQLKEGRLKVFRASYLSVKVTEDTAQVFQIEGVDQGKGPNDGTVYRAQVFGANACIVQVNYHKGDQAGSRTIAKSIATAK